jgi:putative lipoic acid-binding regulatory protein
MTHAQRTPFEFPCVFPIKALGLNADDFEAVVVDIVRRHAPHIADDAVSCRLSRSHKYLSVTVTLIAESRDQLDAIYQDLSNHERVLMLL